jgi:hypothetical protein
VPAAAPSPELVQALSAYDHPLVGAHLPGSSLTDLVNSDKFVILHFLRHLGCIYCKHSVDMLGKLREAEPNFPPIYFVHQSPVEKGDAFFGTRYPNVGHISDPELELYNLFGIKSLNPVNLLNPKGVVKGFQLTAKGYRNELKDTGNIWILSGTFLFQEGQLIWTHRASFAGDEPNWQKLKL